MKLLTVLLMLIFLSAGTASADASDRAPTGMGAALPAPAQRAPARSLDLRRGIDFQMSVVRTGIAAAGLLVFVWGLRPSARNASRPRRLRAALLLLLAVAAYSSYYQFFRFSHVRGFATSDNFHYYLGSKYFSELGYFGLYECSLHALTERGLPPLTGPHRQARNLRTMRAEPATEITRSGEDCPERFGPERWELFGNEVVYFTQKWPKHIRNATWLDHGYHPPPSWTLVGGAVAQNIHVGDPLSAYLLARLDRVLIAITLIGIGGAFGLETACLVALLWGTGALWRYTWVGDGFLRHLWWAAAMAGVIALRRGFTASAGSALMLSTLFRIFPGTLGIGYLMHAMREILRAGRPVSKHFVFAAGAGSSLVLVLLLSAWTSGHGLSVYQDFVVKLREFGSTPISNDVGLGVLSHWVFPTSSLLPGLMRGALTLGFITLFWRAMARTEDWEAAAAGALLIPILVNPANYYLSLFAIVALTAARRPRIGVILLVTGLLWNANSLLLYQQYAEFDWASAVAVIGCVAVLLELARPVAASVPPVAPA